MPWQRVQFKTQKVWALVDDEGKLHIEGGRVAIRYSKQAGTKIYRAGASGLTSIPDSPILDLPEGVESPQGEAKKKGNISRGFGKAGTRTVQQGVMAAQAAKELIEGLPQSTIRCFTDGSCLGNPGPAGAGALVIFPDGRVCEESCSLGEGTNNVGELAAIGCAMDRLEEASVPFSSPIALFTDSSYSHGVLCRGWKAKANKELIGDLREQLSKWPNLTVHWVAGHVGIPENERADELANRGAAGISSIEWKD